MALHPDAGALAIERLGPPNLVELFAFLDRDPVLNVYLVALARTLSDRKHYSMRIDWGEGSWQGDVFMASICIVPRPAMQPDAAPSTDSYSARAAVLTEPSRFPLPGERISRAGPEEATGPPVHAPSSCPPISTI